MNPQHQITHRRSMILLAATACVICAALQWGMWISPPAQAAILGGVTLLLLLGDWLFCRAIRNVTEIPWRDRARYMTQASISRVYDQAFGQRSTLAALLFIKPGLAAAVALLALQAEPTRGTRLIFATNLVMSLVCLMEEFRCMMALRDTGLDVAWQCRGRKVMTEPWPEEMYRSKRAQS